MPVHVRCANEAPSHTATADMSSNWAEQAQFAARGEHTDLACEGLICCRSGVSFTMALQYRVNTGYALRVRVSTFRIATV